MDEQEPVPPVPPEMTKPPIKPKSMLVASLPPQPVPPKPSATLSETMYEVLEDYSVPRSGGVYLLRKGKVISSRGYDVVFLKSIGVKLQKVVVSSVGGSA